MVIFMLSFLLCTYLPRAVMTERQVRETVTTTTSTAAPLHFGLALTGSGQCPDGLGVSAVPLSRC
eukprot:s7367_g1.t1